MSNMASAQYAETLGVFANTELNGDWMFTEIRELDGTLSGCFMSTEPIQGDFSFENADLNILAMREGDAVVRRVAILDIADPSSASSILNPLGLFLYVGKSGEKRSYFTPLGFKERLASNRFAFEGNVDDRFLDKLSKEPFAAVQVASGNDRRQIVYSLTGSAKSIAKWRECNESL